MTPGSQTRHDNGHYLVSGATGFIGRFLVGELARAGAEITVVVRPGAEAKAHALAARWGERVRLQAGHPAAPRLGLDDGWVARHRGTLGQVFHLGVLHGSTAHATQLANELGATLHLVSTASVAGDYHGVFTEDMFAQGQRLTAQYQEAAYRAEETVRAGATVPWRIYRPAIVIGHSRTGEVGYPAEDAGLDEVFRVLRMAGQLPRLLPVISPRLGETNMVPVDFVAQAVAHIATLDEPAGRTYHLVNPQPQRAVCALNVFADEAGAPHLVEVMPKHTLSALLRIPGARRVIPYIGAPLDVLERAEFSCRFDCANTTTALAGSGIEVPELASYAPAIWKYWAAQHTAALQPV